MMEITMETVKTIAFVSAIQALATTAKDNTPTITAAEIMKVIEVDGTFFRASFSDTPLFTNGHRYVSEVQVNEGDEDDWASLHIEIWTTDERDKMNHVGILKDKEKNKWLQYINGTFVPIERDVYTPACVHPDVTLYVQHLINIL